MAQKDDIRNQFFPKQKRRMTLERWVPKRNNENEKRVLVEFVMPLTGQSVRSFPDFLQESFHLFEKEGQPATTLELSTELEGMTMQFYDTGSSAARAHVFVAATLRGFELIRVPDGDKFLTALKFNTTILRNMTVLKFLNTYEGMDLWSDFDPQELQMAIGDEKPAGAKQLELSDEDEAGEKPAKKARTQ